MKLTAPKPVLKVWRRALRDRVRRNATLKRERRRAKPSVWRRNHAWGMLRYLVSLAIAGAVLTGVHLDVVVNTLLLWSLLILMLRAHQVSLLGFSPDAHWLHYLWPVEDTDVYDHVRGVILKSSAWLGLDWLAFAWALAWRLDNPWLFLAGGILAVTQWATMLLISVKLACAKPRLPYGVTLLPLGILLFLSVRFQDSGGLVGELLTWMGSALRAATPSGWLVLIWNGDKTAGQPAGTVILLAWLVVALLLLRRENRLRRQNFSLETLIDGDAIAPPDEHDELIGRSENADATPARAITFNREQLRAEVFRVLNGPPGERFTRHGFVEQSLAGWLNIRERVLMDFAWGGGMPWLRRWKIATGMLLVTVIVGILKPSLALPPALLSIMIALPFFGGRWRCFDYANISSFGPVTSHACFPAGFGELARLMLKFNALLCVAAIPLVLVAVHFGLAPSEASALWTVDYGLRGLALVLVLQPIWIIGRFSANTNDSRMGGWRVLCIGIIAIVLLVAFVPLSVAGFMVANPAIAAICLLCTGAISHGTLALYGWLWGRNRFDLLPVA